MLQQRTGVGDEKKSQLLFQSLKQTQTAKELKPESFQAWKMGWLHTEQSTWKEDGKYSLQ